jgi:hypothetical protein
LYIFDNLTPVTNILTIGPPYRAIGCDGLLHSELSQILNFKTKLGSYENYSCKWSSGHNFWLQIQRFWDRFPALPDFLRSSGSGDGVHSASLGQLRSYLEEKVAAPV